MPKVRFGRKFDTMYRELVSGNPSLSKEVAKRILRFKKNSNDSRLRNHALTKKMKGKFAFSITDDIRIVYEWFGKSTARFLVIGTHNKVYKKT